MKKSEFLAAAAEAGVQSTNVKTFINKNKKFAQIDIKKAALWLKEVEAANKKKADDIRNKANADRFGMSVKKYLLLKSKAVSILNWFSTGHSMGYKARLMVNGQLFADVDNTQDYSKSCKYRADHGSYTLSLTKKEIELIDKCKEVPFTWSLPDGRKLVSTGSKGSFQLNLK